MYKKRNIPYKLVSAVITCCVFTGLALSGPDISAQSFTFSEIWAYLMSGEEKTYTPGMPVSDIGYFGAGISSFGKLADVPDRAKIKGFNGRVHLVVAQVTNRALNHFCIDPELPIRNRLIDDIAAAAVPYDGVQIDFELIPPEDRENYYSFLSELKERIGSRILSVAIPARTRYIKDAYEYERLAEVADKILIMAYDEHWSTSAPGSIASIEWCERITAYAVQKIPPHKLIMGMPFYGRAWASANPAKAYRHPTLQRLIEEKEITRISRTNHIPHFTYQETVTVSVYFEDRISVLKRTEMYHRKNIRNIG
ncbi:MAG: glycoside hydrolase, partial [Spirochaetaceae bacterium]|nr:glycoside hydrolase [Spirochaetaceae bacterium]